MPLAPAYSYRMGETKSGKCVLREPASGIPARERMVQEREPSLAQWTRMAARRSHSSCNITAPGIVSSALPVSTSVKGKHLQHHNLCHHGLATAGGQRVEQVGLLLDSLGVYCA